MRVPWMFVACLVTMVAACGDDAGPSGGAGFGGAGAGGTAGVAGGAGSSGAGGTGATGPQFEVEQLGRCARSNAERDLYWGDTHVHTRLSLDANTQGTRTTVADAYAFAKGASIGVQPYTEEGTPTRTIEIDRPLDFMMVSDHAEFFGTISVCEDPNPPDCENAPDDATGYCSAECQFYRRDPAGAFFGINVYTAIPQGDAGFPLLCGDDGSACEQAGRNVWEDVQREAEAAYDRTEACSFTSFVGYEWTAGPGARNLHRNVLFRNGIVPGEAASYFDENFVEGLWSALRSECIDAGTGCDALTIPHNSNLSTGTYFEDQMQNGQPFDAAYVSERAVMEPIFETFQHKGDSECLPGGLAADEECGFEKLPFNNLAGANQGSFGDPSGSDFVRSALRRGMQFEQALGTNPFKHGFVASTDTHIAAGGAAEETVFLGHGGAGQPNRDLPPPEGFPDVLYFNPGGLAAVWATENTREGLWLAMKARETFGTSGPRIAVRMFGGWDFPATLCESTEFVQTGYNSGVPMGGDLPARPDDTSRPRFAIMASQDPTGAPLQRIQVVKGVVGAGGETETVVDVVGDAENGASVDTATCERTGDDLGSAQLCTVWEDPDFDPSARAYYYVRVLENPTCRWSTYQCADAGADCDNPAREIDRVCCDPATGINVAQCASVDCSDPDALSEMQARCCAPRVEPIIQERAWTSPIWYTPAP